MNFKKFLISEMPLSNFRHDLTKEIGEKDEPKDLKHSYSHNYFLNRDRNIIKGKLEKQLANKFNYTTKHNWNILFIEADDSGFPEFKKYVYYFMEKNNIPVDGHITFVKNSSTGHPMSPWMVAHNIGHAVFDNTFAKSFKKEVKRIIHDHFGGYFPYDGMKRMAEYLPFTSAKALVSSKTKRDFDRKIADEDEFIHELMAYYLTTGSIKLVNYPDQTVPNEIENIFDNILDQLVGKIIYDYFNE